jgi:hypothetical protein
MDMGFPKPAVGRCSTLIPWGSRAYLRSWRSTVHRRAHGIGRQHHFWRAWRVQGAGSPNGIHDSAAGSCLGPAESLERVNLSTSDFASA